jgi:hypothetical protein
MGGFDRLKFPPKIVSALENNTWMVYEASPNYMFHYIEPKGLVGIYIGATPSFDFRSVLHDPDFEVSSLDAVEYRIKDRRQSPLAANEFA